MRTIPLLLPCLLLAQYVEDSIDVHFPWISSLVYNSRADVIYGACEMDGLIFTIACSTNRVLRGQYTDHPLNLVYDSTDNKAYCTVYNYEDVDSVLVIDGTTHLRARGIPVPEATDLVWDPVPNRLYVSCTEANQVTVIDCATDTVIGHIQTSPEPLRMHLNNRYRKLYVQCHGSERLEIIDLHTLEVIKNITVPGLPEAGYYSEAVDKCYCGAGVSVVVVDGATDSVVAQIGQTGRSLSMVAVGRHSLVMAGGTHGGSDSVYVIDAASDTAVRAIPGVSSPYDLYWSEISDLVYCASSQLDQVAVIAGNGSRMLGVLQVGDCPHSFAAAPRHRYLYVGHLGSGKVYVVRDTVSGIAETPDPERAEPLRPTLLTRAQLLTELQQDPNQTLFDASGREVLRPNTIPPGVYFVRRLTADSQQLPASCKVLVTN